MRGGHSAGKAGSASIAVTGTLLDNDVQFVQFVGGGVRFDAAVRSLHRAPIGIGEDEAEGQRAA